VADKGWKREFEDPIPLPDGRRLVTLLDAGEYITTLSKAEQQLDEWQTAIEALMLCSRGGDTMLARIGVMKALNRHVERVFNPDLKETHWGKRKLKRTNDRADLRRYEQASRRSEPPKGSRRSGRRRSLIS
jgi:hypothetical protein